MVTTCGLANETPISISLNFDSLNEAARFPKGFIDPSFFKGFDRVSDLLAKRNLKATIFIIGRDLTNPEIRDRVADWGKAGFEIGNHSYSHHCNFGALPPKVLIEEITLSHNLIAEATGKEPKGFIAPAWANSQFMIKQLVNLEYVYDTSLFPSAALFPMVLKIALNHLNYPERFWRILNRRDWLQWMIKPIHPFLTNSEYKVIDKRKLNMKGELVVLPLPTRSRFSIPHWHTKGFIFGWESHYKELNSLLETYNYMYYLIHPADFMSVDDLPLGYAHNLERFQVPVEEKIARLDEAFRLLEKSGRTSKTMIDLSNHFSNNLIV